MSSVSGELPPGPTNLPPPVPGGLPPVAPSGPAPALQVVRFQNEGEVGNFFSAHLWEIVAILVAAAAAATIALGTLTYLQPGALNNAINTVGSVGIMAGGSAVFVLSLIALAFKIIDKKRQEQSRQDRVNALADRAARDAAVQVSNQATNALRTEQANLSRASIKIAALEARIVELQAQTLAFIPQDIRDAGDKLQPGQATGFFVMSIQAYAIAANYGEKGGIIWKLFKTTENVQAKNETLQSLRTAGFDDAAFLLNV